MFYQPVWSYDGFQLVQRPDTPNYHIYWKPRLSRRVRRQSTGTSDLDTAKRALVEFARRMSRPVTRDEDQVLLLDCLVDYVAPIIERAHTWIPEKTALMRWTEYVEAYDVATVADLTLEAQDRYVKWRQANGANSTSTLARELGVMRAALRNAWKNGRLANPKYVKSMPQAAPRSRFLFPDEARRLLAACEEDHLRLFVMIALHTLQRPGAILGLRVEQVRFQEGLIDFLPPAAVQSRKRKPVVPISDTLRPVLEEACAESVSGYVVEHNERPLWHVKRSFRNACDRAGLRDVTPYTLRHTGATLLLAAGVPIREVAGMLGHTEHRTTEMYGKHHPSFLRNAKSAVDALFSPIQTPLVSLEPRAHGAPPLARGEGRFPSGCCSTRLL